MSTVVILTALALEQQAVIEKLTDVSDYIHPDSNSIYKIGLYTSDGRALKLIVGRTNQTNINAGLETVRVIEHFAPDYIFFVGVAGGMKDVTVGDIVIGSDVIGYERGNAKEQFHFRPQFGFSSYELEQQAVSFANSKKWLEQRKVLVNHKFHNAIKVLSGTIASGEKVIGSTKSDVYSFLKLNASHALAVEMEGLGFLEACRAYPLIKSLLIRGISDLVEGKADADKEGSQPYASNNATSFMLALIDHLKITGSVKDLTIREKLCEITPKLYPAGLRENGIWLRAGGDLSLVNLYSNGKSQWIEALFLIEKGGGGDIDFGALIAEMQKDFPKSESLKEL
jgi:adenosylhomocysteine nucleosidase